MCIQSLIPAVLIALSANTFRRSHPTPVALIGCSRATLPPGAHVLLAPVLTVKSVASVTLTPKLDAIVCRKGEDFFARSLALFETLRSDLSAKDLFGLLAALVQGSLRV